MKFSAALSLAIAPVALAKAVQNTYPVVKRSEHLKGAAAGAAAGAGGVNINLGAAAGIPALVNAGSVTQVIVIWANPGAGAETSTINKQVTVTQTVTSGATETAAAGAAATHSVVVGGAGGLVYTPAEVKAKVGDMVIFTFMSMNHTATQSTFDKPCDAMEGGMDSGFQANPDNSIDPPPQVAMQVMVETPLWFYCKQKGHCGKGMTFSINPTAEKSQAMFQAMAIAQKGTGEPSAITGGNGTAAPPAAPPAAAPPAAAPAAPPAESGAAVPPTQGMGELVPGTGQCVCAVTCSPGSFPAVQAQGLGAFGGMAGGLPASMMEA